MLNMINRCFFSILKCNYRVITGRALYWIGFQCISINSFEGYHYFLIACHSSNRIRYRSICTFQNIMHRILPCENRLILKSNHLILLCDQNTECCYLGIISINRLCCNISNLIPDCLAVISLCNFFYCTVAVFGYISYFVVKLI